MRGTQAFTETIFRFSVLGLMSLAILPPFIPLAGPLSLDDCFPLVATLLGLFALLFHRGEIPLKATLLGFALLAVLGLTSSAINSDSLADCIRLTARSSGRALFYGSLVVGTHFIVARPQWPRYALLCFCAAATLEALICIGAYLLTYRGPFGIGVIRFPDWSVLRGHFRVQGTFSGVAGEFETTGVSCNFLAAYMLMSSVVTFGVALTEPKIAWKNVLFVSTALQLATLYLTYTRSAMIGLTVAILIAGGLMGRARLALLVLAIGSALTLSTPNMRAKFLGEAHDRYALWEASLAITRDNPWFGTGDGKYEEVLRSDQKYFETPYGIASAGSHNSILLAAAHLGIAGGFAQAFLYALVVIAAVRAHRQTGRTSRVVSASILAAMAGCFVQDQFNNLANVPKVATQFWFLFAVLLAMPPEERSAR